MPRGFKTTVNECSIDISAQLAEVSKNFQNNQFSFDEALEEIDRIYKEYLISRPKLSFKELLILAHLSGDLYDYGFVYDQNSSSNIDQLQIEMLDINRPTLFRYRDTAYNKIKSMFGHNIFKYLFVNQAPNISNPYPVTKSDINKNIQKLKNLLCKNIVSALKITELEGIDFFDSTGAIYENGESNYVKLMNNSKVSSFLNRYLDFILDNPIDLNNDTLNASKLLVISDLLALNNFDQLLKQELGSLIKFDPNFEGSINNTNYTGDIDGVSTEYWADDSEQGKDIRNYTSNLAKFILSQIPKVRRIGSNYEVQEGQYLNSNDLYVLGHILKQAEYEYNLKHLNDPNFKPIILNISTTEAFRTLLKLTDLPAIKNAKSELLDSIDYFLYIGNKDTKSIESLYDANVSKNLNILDIEGLIAFESVLSYAPTYTEFDEDGISEHKNYGGVYEQGNALKRNLTDFLFQLLKSGKKLISKTLDIKKLQPTSTVMQTFLILSLGYNPLATTFLEDFATKHIKDLQNLLEDLLKALYDKNLAKEVKLEIKNGNDINAYKFAENYISGLSINSNFKRDYETSLSERAIVEFNNQVGDSLPVYRLNSALTNDSWFIHNYRQLHGKNLNLFADNPILFSKWSSYNLDSNNGEINWEYKDSTSYLVDFGNELETTGFNELIPQDQLHLLFLNNLIGLSENSKKTIPYLFHCLPVAYSDKKSVGVKTINLKAIFENPISNSANKKTSFAKVLELYRINPEATIEEIRNIDYFYRKNKQSALINSILEKWYSLCQIAQNLLINLPNLLQAESFSPINNLQLDFTENRVFSDLQNKFLALDNWLKTLTENDLRTLLWFASKNNIELIDEQDYVYKKQKVRGINNTILYDFQLLLTFNTFVDSQNKSFNKFLESKEFEEMLTDIKKHIIDSDKDSTYYKLLSPYFEKKWVNENKKEGIPKHWEVIEKLDKNKASNFINTLKVFAAMSNLIRNNYLDLVSKFYYLDPAKGSFNNAYQERARRIDSMSKRMVLFPATIQQYGQGLLKGVSQTAKVCIIEDPSELVFNISGVTADQDIFDGSGFVSPFWSIMENNSLPGHGIDGTKKTFGVSTDNYRSTLFKWAEYPMTNAAMRMSIKLSPSKAFNLLTMFKKMHNLTWEEDIDITTNMFGKSMFLPKGGPVIMSDGFTFKRVSNIVKTGRNQYSISYIQVNENGTDIENTTSTSNVTIDSIYKLWQVLGGLQSYSLENGRLVPSERSIEATCDYIFNVGTVKQKTTLYNLNTVYLPLRDKFIAIAANKSAVKRGVVNVNKTDVAWRSDTELNYFTINTSNFGIQLDANHHSDLADVREMSQTISAMAALGRTSDLAELIYDSIAGLVKISLKKSSKFLTKLELQGIESALNLISKRLIDKLAKEDKIASTEAFIDMFSDELDTLVLPISDRRFYKTFIKDVLEDLNKSSIRRRYSGLGGILNPASNVLLVYEVEGKQYLYDGLLREAKLRISKAPHLVKYLEERWKSQQDNNPENFDLANNKDIDIIRMFIKASIGVSPELLPLQFEDNNPNIQLITSDKLSLVKLLDTVTYETPEGLMTVCLDNIEDITKFWSLVDINTDESGLLHMKVYLEKDIPHDLRPQYISWTTKYANGVLRYHNIYTTRAANLSGIVGKEKYNLDNIDTLISDLAENGEAIKRSC